MTITANYRVQQASFLADFLAAQSGLAKARLKECMNKGGVWLQRHGGKLLRSRKAKTMLRPGDRVCLYYDEAILSQKPVMPKLIANLGEYSVWDKPAGLLAQGTKFGDHCSLLRVAQGAFSPPREVFLIHRLDREASGLMVIAHTRRAAAAFGRLLQSHHMLKQYEITVRGIWDKAESGTITLPLDGKEAVTGYQLLSTDSAQSPLPLDGDSDQSPLVSDGDSVQSPLMSDGDVAPGASRLLITLQTGRLHQIRRHFAMSGFPVMGDPRYGSGNKNTTGLALRAVRLAFLCPISGQTRDFHL